MNKAQTVYTSRLLNKKAHEAVKATRKEHSNVSAIERGLLEEHKHTPVLYASVGGIALCTAYY